MSRLSPPSAPVAKRSTTIRFSRDLWDQVQREARRTGLSAAQFVRECTLIRIWLKAAERGDASTQEKVLELLDDL